MTEQVDISQLAWVTKIPNTALAAAPLEITLLNYQKYKQKKPTITSRTIRNVTSPPPLLIFSFH